MSMVFSENSLDIFNLNNFQHLQIYKFIELLKKNNLKINLVGKSTLINPLRSHILDSIQISRSINNKKSKIIDIGTGAGLPGIVLSIYGYFNLSLVDSNTKKINFIKKAVKELNLSLIIINSRIEMLTNLKFDYVVSRALAKLDRLLLYSSKLSHKNTKLIFLKGKKINDEINEAKKNWNFNFSLKKSLSDPRGRIIIINRFQKK